MRKTALLLVLLLLFIPFAYADDTDLTETPYFWYTNGYHIGGIPIEMDTYPVEYGGVNAIQMQPDDTYIATHPYDTCELDGEYVAVAPGDRIYYSAYIWTENSTVEDSYWRAGAVIGLDMYDNDGAGRICEIATRDGVTINYATQGEQEECGVAPGSGEYTYVYLNFIVNATYQADAYNPEGGHDQWEVCTPSYFIPWLVWCSSNATNEEAKMYVYNTTLQLNPESEPTPTPTASPAYFLPEQLPNGIDALAGLCAVLAVGFIIFWPFIQDARRRF